MSNLAIGDRLHGFPGGLQLRHHKQIACSRPLTAAPLPDTLYIPLSTHQAEPGRLLVSPGDRVLRGQALSIAGDDRQVVAHASSSGRIVGLVEWPGAWPPGSNQTCLALIPDGEDRAEAPQPLPGWQDQDRDSLIDHLRERGLVGMGGALFPTAAKLRGDWGPINTLIINGAECEPWIACDEMLMRNRPDAVIEGALILARACGAEQVLIAIEDQMGVVAESLGQALKSFASAVRLAKVSTIYPEGGERQLIQTLTGLEVPHDGLPQDLGLLCQNVATAVAARDAVIDGLAVTERIVTVTGPGVAAPCNLLARIGTPFHVLISAAGGYRDEVSRLILGGPMSGIALTRDDVPVSKGSNCLLALTTAETEPRRPSLPCINCGACVSACPASLLPQLIYRSLAGQQFEQAKDLNLADCIECGCCAQVCPSQIPLVDWYKYGKGELRARDLDARRAALARRRFEAREQRQAHQQAEREARRQRRRERLEQADQARDEIQAAIERARQRKS